MRTGHQTAQTARTGSRLIDSGIDPALINAGVDETMTGTRGLGRVMSSWHSGQIQTYLGVVAIGMLALLLLYAWLV